MIAPGLRGELEKVVMEADTASAVGSGGLSVLATPVMIAWMERTAMQSVQPFLAEGQGTVGTSLAVAHTAATPVGMRVRFESELTCVEGRKLTFRVEAFDEAGPIGTATHARVIIDNARFMEKALAKLRK